MTRAVVHSIVAVMLVCSIACSTAAVDDHITQAVQASASSTHYRRQLISTKKQPKAQTRASPPTQRPRSPPRRRHSKAPLRKQHAKPQAIKVRPGKRSPPRRSPLRRSPPQPPKENSWDVILSIVIVGRSAPTTITKLQNGLDQLGFQAYPCKVAHSGNVAMPGLKSLITLSVRLEAKTQDAALAALQGAVTPQALSGKAGGLSILNVFVLPLQSGPA